MREDTDTYFFQGMTLEGLYEKFNLYRPEDFKGHSLSVGDVVLLNRSGRKQTFFVDTIGFKEFSGFDQGLKLMQNAKKRPDVSKERKTVTRGVRKETGLYR